MAWFKALFLFLLTAPTMAGQSGVLALQARVPSSSWSYQTHAGLIGGSNEEQAQWLYVEADPGSQIVVNGTTYSLDQPLQLSLRQWHISRPMTLSSDSTPLYLSIIEP